MIEIQKLKDWKPPKDWAEIQTIDVHTCGEPLRIISGFPKLKRGKTLLEKRAHAKNNFDQLRKTYHVGNLEDMQICMEQL